MSCPFGKESLDKLKEFIKVCAASPDILSLPDLNFFKEFIESFGGKVPSPAKKMAAEAPSDIPEEASAPVESEPESDLELDTEGCVEPDPLDENQKMGDPNKEVSEEDSDKSSEKRMEATSQFSEGNFDKAIELYTEAIELNPSSALLFAKRGQAYLKKTKPNACIKDCTKALELNPDSAAAYKFRGRAYRLLGEWEKAAKDLRQACNIDLDEQIDEWLKEVTPNAQKIEQHKLKLERKKLEKEQKEKLERARKAREAHAKASGTTTTQSEEPSANAAPKSDDFYKLLQDPDIRAAFSDPEVSAAFADVSQNPANFYKYQKSVSNVVLDATKQVIDPDSNTNIVPLHSNTTESMDTAFSLYYGKFQSAASKVKLILSHLEGKCSGNEQYQTIVSDCQKFYVSQRLSILSTAVSKALSELKEKYKNDYSILFRSCGLFIMKTCQDEAHCYHYFFTQYSLELNDYLGVLCQYLYDTLRPSLITINHVEVLSELCGILQREMLAEKTLNNDHLSKYVEVVKQLLQDVEERLVFRTNIFFQHDLLSYNPSPGDLAYPEKLEQMENIALELQEVRTDSRSSVASLESQEVAAINSTNPLAGFRSYTGNSPADLHGMWYPTVKRTLVILSRLYFCLDRETFQGLAQEALLICIQTVERAANLISTRKTEIDGRLFQIKHLLIIREQIAPFQVDFTVKEMSLDFSSVQKAAVELLNNRDRLFTFGSNNALLEFLLEGTPRVREYLVDSRKEIDKQLKQACEAFISYATYILTGALQQWKKRADIFLQNVGTVDNTPTLPEQEFGKAKFVAAIVSEVLKNMKVKVPEIQRSMMLYLSNRETEFILFRPIKNNVMNVFVQIEQTLTSSGYSAEDMLLIACPSPEQVNVLICSVSLTSEQEYNMGK